MKKRILQLLTGLTLVITFLVGGFIGQPVKAGVGDTIIQTFPDANLAKAVADQIAGGNVNATLTQGMIDGCRELNAYYRDIQDITGIDVLSNLDCLYLADNQLTSLPESIGSLGNLLSLDLNNNKLTSLPESLVNLVNLDYFDLGYNQLTSLPESIGSLGNLRNLDLNNNQLTNLPDSIGNLVNVGYLGLGNNQLTSLPDSIDSLLSLWYLYLENNLLPTNYQDILNTLGLGFTVNYEMQAQLMLKTSLSPYMITSESDLNDIDLLAIAELSDSNGNRVISPTQHLILENYVDENNNVVDIDEYILNGVVQKDGTIFAQVRATGTGLFPNNSDHAITEDKIELIFEASYYSLSFDLNGGTGTVPTSQWLVEGAKGIAMDNPTREGYTFKEWNTAQDGSGTGWIVGNTPMSANDVTLYAQWEENKNPVPPTPEQEKQETGLLLKGALPKTGGYEVLIISLTVLGTGLLIGTRAIKKK